MARNSLYKDLTGMKFWALEVLKRDKGKTDSSKSCYWICKCECGNIVSRKTATLKLAQKGAVPNCGCVNRKRLFSYSQSMKKHGMTNTRIFGVWGNMLDRCNNSNNIEYHLYGGRGISVCAEWSNDFESFYKWSVLNGYKKGLSIDRIDTNGNYEPSNCRWATAKEQIRNRRNTRFVEFDGQKKTLGEISEIYKVDYAKLYKKVINRKMNVKEAIKELGGNADGCKENA